MSARLDGLPPASDWHVNSRATGTDAAPPDRTGALAAQLARAHRLLPGYGVTPLRELPAAAGELGLERLWVKDETSRLGLPSFKVLGASYATWRALRERSAAAGEATTLARWREAVAALGPLTLVTATDGNHGRALAYVARLLGVSAHVLVPSDMAAARIDAIRGEGAAVEVVDGSYDDAIARLRAFDRDDQLVVSDTSWDGYTDIPRWVIEGYAKIFAEIDAQLADAGAAGPDLVLVQAGVGALASAAVLHWRARPGGPSIVCVEPDDAGCVLAALSAGAPASVPGPHRSILAGLNCGLVSAVAWPILRAGLDGAVTVADEHARAAVRAMHDEGVLAGETGAAGLAGLLALRASDPATWRALGLAGVANVLTICTEGVTDPLLTAAIVGDGHGEEITLG